MEKGIKLLDRINAELTQKDPHISKAMEELVLGLYDLRSESSIEEWDHFSRSEILDHPILTLLHQDPFTRRSFQKPRGYDGDAMVLDFIYGLADLKKFPLSDLGREIHSYTIGSPACKAVRARKEIISKTIDAQAKDMDNPKILSLACGHLREAHTSEAIQNGRIKELVAMDYDKESLELVKREFGKLKVKTVNASVRDILTKKHKELGRFDFLYVSGLYDYLSQRVAIRLTLRLFEMLNSGGRLLVSNFLPQLKNVGYMETFMDWRLIYRDQAQLNAVVADIPLDMIYDKRLFVEENDNIAFLRVIKA